jgi:hypothetical protein
MANYVYLNGVVVSESTSFGGGGGGGGGGLVQFTLDGLTQTVIEDTVTPANTKPLPVKVIETVNPNAGLIVDFLDAGLLDTAGTNIPRSSLAPLSIVASLAAEVKKIQIIEDIGAFMGLYSDALATNLICYLPLGGGVVETVIPAGTAIYIKHLEDTDITSGKIAMNFVG